MRAYCVLVCRLVPVCGLRCLGFIHSSHETMMPPRRVFQLSALLCGLLCSSSAFTVRSGTDVSQLLSQEGHHQHCQQQTCRSVNKRSSPDISTAGKKRVALSVASGGAAASMNDNPSRLQNIRTFVSKNFFLLGMIVAVALARAFPSVSQVVCFLSNTPYTITQSHAAAHLVISHHFFHFKTS